MTSEKQKPDSYPLTIFYDGACRICEREMMVYRRSNPMKRLDFVNINRNDFAPEKYGKKRQDFLARLHVCDAQGTFYTGVDAFLAIWRAYPNGSFYPLLGRVVSFPPLLLLARLGYSLFARYRHLLPRH